MEPSAFWKRFVHFRIPTGFVCCICQEQSKQGQQLSVARIAQLEHEAIDSSDTHLALAAQHESKVPS